MTHYSSEADSVRVDFFKPSGKWYTTEAVKFVSYNGCIHEAFKESLARHLNGRLSGMIAVCLDPYHQHAHPLMITVGEE